MKRVTASDAKNRFGGLLDDVATLGRVDIVKHGRVVAVVLSPRALEELLAGSRSAADDAAWGRLHAIPPADAKAARVVRRGGDFDE